jgi:osmotically-inducible protein OsmY
MEPIRLGMRKNWVIAIALWAALMLLGRFVWSGRIESSLEMLARQTLESHPESLQFKDVHVEFEGQTAVLTGQVNKGAARGLVENIVRQELRKPSLFGGKLNPVASVRNQIDIEPLPPGWLVLWVSKERADLSGVIGSQDELEELTASVKKKCDKPGRQFQSTLRVDSDRFGAGGDLESTLTDLDREMTSVDPKGRGLVSQVGSTWSPLPLSDLGEMKSALAQKGMVESDWIQNIQGLAKAASEKWETNVREEMEAARRGKLPLPHVFLASKGESVLVQGIVGTAELKTLIIDAALKAYPEKKVVDQISISTNRRPVVDVSTLLLFFPTPTTASGGKQLAFGMPGEGWKIADMASGDLEAAITSVIPKGIETTLVNADQAAVVKWIQAADEEKAATLKPYLTLAIFGSRVWLRGEVAEEATRSQIVEAVRRTYPNHLLVQYIRLNPRCMPADGPLQTALSLPVAPEAGSAGILAFAVPGEVWRKVEVTPALLEPNGVSRSGIVPAGPLFQIAAEDFSEALDALKNHQLQLGKPKTQ